METNTTSDAHKVFKMFVGGPFDTNSYLISSPGGNILVDAPEGAAAEFRETPISLLLLTHGHYDHVWDAAKIVRHHGCPVAMHPVTEEMLADRSLLRRFGIDLEVEPVKADIILREGPGQLLLDRPYDIYEIPGHCPGSLCFHDVERETIYGGDVLFSGGVGRWDLPGGDRDLLLSGIRSKLLPLPPQTTLYPGHGPATKIGVEKKM